MITFKQHPNAVDAFRKKENDAAVAIQSWFRGCQVRAYIREALEEFAEMKEREERKARLEREEKLRDQQARKMHYLLSTKQGPFRDINEVLHQRYKPLEPTLRVAEPINHLQLAREALRQEERMLNVSDKMFLPFSSYHKNEKYIPMIHTSSKYNGSSYGQKHFRSQDPKKWIGVKSTQQTVLEKLDILMKENKIGSLLLTTLKSQLNTHSGFKHKS
ncbi:Spata17 [Phodopus roborovskii]|uniref:Spata17 protein n=1 Tax=Phodopus roborovskii TaxID=109678 RepID=A0AAU9ZAN6_PHORO|nr:Spata17 [Phodopus roborovskii]